MSPPLEVVDASRPAMRDQVRRRQLGIHYDPGAFGEFSEAIARFIGTARFLIFQSVVVVMWLSWNMTAPLDWRFDPNPYGVLTLALSLQAAYAAPLILLAQNRQEDREREQSADDRKVTTRTQADTEFLARELASVRMVLASVVTTDELHEQLEKLAKTIQQHGDSTR